MARPVQCALLVVALTLPRVAGAGGRDAPAPVPDRAPAWRGALHVLPGQAGGPRRPGLAPMSDAPPGLAYVHPLANGWQLQASARPVRRRGPTGHVHGEVGARYAHGPWIARLTLNTSSDEARAHAARRPAKARFELSVERGF